MAETSLPGNLCEYLEASAHRFSDRAAVVDSDGSIVTYRELNDRANRVAGFLLGSNLACANCSEVIEIEKCFTFESEQKIAHATAPRE